ncbi:hypothetical protein WJX84_004319 [Apatococcus fuscideae]|uniref:Uncharacterized protein n=1 Tax=Apatococcus fuscideae TaxID=2026836 RepID=A0AAW1SV33_9CHLO
MSSSTSLAYRPHHTNLDNLKYQGLFFIITSAAAALVLPVLNYVAIWIHHTRWSIESWVDWGIVVLTALVALIALFSRSSGLLLLHVVMSTMAGAALGAHNAAIFLDWELRCGGQLNSIDQICTTYQRYHVLVAVQGAVTVVAMAIPALFTLLTLLRLEAEKAVDRKKMQWQVLEVLQQRSLLQQSQPLSMPIESLSGLLAVLRSSPYNEWRLLAAKTTELLLEQGYDLPALATSPNPLAGVGPAPGGQYFDVPESTPLRGAMVVTDIERGSAYGGPSQTGKRGAKVAPEPYEEPAQKIPAVQPASPNIVINTFTDGSRTGKAAPPIVAPVTRARDSDDGSDDARRERRKKKKDKKKKRHSSDSDSN